MQKDTLNFVIGNSAGCAITARGMFVAPGRKPGPGERKLYETFIFIGELDSFYSYPHCFFLFSRYLLIEGPSQYAVTRARAEVMRILEETTMEVGLAGGEQQRYGKYSVV